MCRFGPSMKFLLTTLLGCLVLALASATDPKIKWCVKSQSELNKCNKLSSKEPKLVCLLQPSVTDCLRSIKDGLADAITVDGENVYKGGLKNYELHPIIAEKYKKGQEPCYAVAVVKKDTHFTIKDLKGKKSCHSCYKMSGGWNLPIGRLIRENKIIWEGVDDKSLEKAVSEFFSASCVPGISKASYPKLCKACKGDCSCTPNENYYDDEGAIRCLKNDGDVAFVCHNKIPVDEKPNYELLCVDDTRKSVADYKSCHLGKEPGHAVISRKDPDLSNGIFSLLSKLTPSDLFSSEGGKDLMFSDSASGLIRLPEITDSFLFLKKEYYDIMFALKGDPLSAKDSSRRVKWCNVGHDEKAKCDNLQLSDVECLMASSVDECIPKVMRGEMDAFACDGGYLLNGHLCDLVAVMAEQYDNDLCYSADTNITSSYYVVAVVKKGSGVTWSNLRNKKSCHTGLNRNAGWKIPNGLLCSGMPDCTLFKYFSEGCAPGAQLGSNMCKLCKGSGKSVGGEESKCKASAEEMFYGYDGAFRCLVEGGGDVAFIKHSIVPSYTDGNGPDWTKDLKSKDFQLICPKFSNEAKEIDQFKECNLSPVPAHAVMTHPDVRKNVVSVLKEAQNTAGRRLFESPGGRNLMFSDSTKCLQEIKGTTKEFLSEKFVDIILNSFKTDNNSPELVRACTLNNYVEEV
ncbi:Serotransferrin-2 Serotransferrin II [Triplophysa tibetana]|uniref:Serotransferrin n=1 Tax=Triplophysa tibetana TaxID=1572043 RepID=A0A5A9PBL2_9TELE|nr:Serotransferrin-2 Serotransferrin II [Triplophysa tibetana]